MFSKKRLLIVIFSFVTAFSFAKSNKNIAVQSDLNKHTKTIFTGLLPDSVKSLIIHIDDCSLHQDWNGNYSNPSIPYTIPVINGNFRFEINLSHPVYIRSGYGAANSPDFIEPGDSIYVNLTQIKNNYIFYTGRGAE